MLKNTIMDELKVAIASATNQEVEAYRPYKGIVAEGALEDIDDVLCSFELEPGCEGYAIADSAVLLAAATEEDGFSFEGLASMIGNESEITEKIKQSSYKVKALAKKMVDAILSFIKNIVNTMFNKNLMLKKFGKLIKKYREKLLKKQFGTNEKKLEKDINIRNFDKLSGLIKEVTDKLTKDDLKNNINDIKGAANFSGFIDKLMAALAYVTGAEAADFDTVAKMNEYIEDKLNKTDALSDLKDKYGFESESMSLSDAKMHLVKISGSIEGLLKTNLKVQDQFRKLSSEAIKKRDKFYKATSFTETEDISKQNARVNKAVTIVAKKQTIYTRTFKYIESTLNALLADMAKIIAA